MGGSSSDVTLFDVSSGLMRRLATERSDVGGNNIDDVIVESFAQDFIRYILHPFACGLSCSFKVTCNVVTSPLGKRGATVARVLDRN